MNELMKELCQSIDKFAEKNILPTLEKDESEGIFRKEIFNGLGELGLCGLTTEEAYGGMSLTYKDLTVVLEHLARYSVSYAVTVSVSSMVQGIIQSYGNEEQKQKYLPDLASGKEIGAFALTESSSGSDAAALKTRAKKESDHYLLNGSKMFITSGGVAKTYIVMARTGEEGHRGISSFIVEDGTDGLEFGKKEDKMGWKVSPTREVLFNNCSVSNQNLLSKEGEGFKIALSALDRGRITIGAISNGVSAQSIKEATNYAIERRQFGKSIFDFQGIQWMLADMATELEASRLLVEKAADNFDNGIDNPMLASMAKMKASDMAMKISTDAVQIFGGVGYTSEYPVERLMRDAKVLQIVEGTNQIQKVVIAKHLAKHYGNN